VVDFINTGLGRGFCNDVMKISRAMSSIALLLAIIADEQAEENGNSVHQRITTALVKEFAREVGYDK
jgi:hypothetical protein